MRGGGGGGADKNKRTFSRTFWNGSELTRGSPGRPVAVNLHQLVNVAGVRGGGREGGEGGEGCVRCTCNPTSDVALGDKGTGEQQRASGERERRRKEREVKGHPAPVALHHLRIVCLLTLSSSSSSSLPALSSWFSSLSLVFFPFQPPRQLSSAQLSLGGLLPCSHCTFLTL